MLSIAEKVLIESDVIGWKYSPKINTNKSIRVFRIVWNCHTRPKKNPRRSHTFRIILLFQIVLVFFLSNAVWLKCTFFYQISLNVWFPLLIYDTSVSSNSNNKVQFDSPYYLLELHKTVKTKINRVYLWIPPKKEPHTINWNVRQQIKPKLKNIVFAKNLYVYI